MQMFQGFKPEGMKKIQQRMGYTGPADQFQSYLQANPDKQMMMNSYVNKAMNMASGGYVRNFQAGGFNLPEKVLIPKPIKQLTQMYKQLLMQVSLLVQLITFKSLVVVKIDKV